MALLYHFPLIDNTDNRGTSSDYLWFANDLVATTGGIISNDCYIGNNSRLRIDTLPTDFSIAFRVIATVSDTTYHTLLSFGSNNDWSLYVYNSTMTCNGVLGSSLFSFDGGIKNIVVIRSNGESYVYINGELKAQKTITYDSICYFWGRKWSSNTYKVDIITQDIRIYDYALSQQEINDYTDALVVHYPLNCEDNGVLKDVSGFGNDTIGEGTTPFHYVGGSPRARKWTSFNGDKQQYKVADLVTCMKDNFSVALWFRCDVGSTDQFLLSQGRNWIGSTNDNYGFNIEISANDRLIIKIGGSSIHITDIDLYTIYHVAVTYSDYVCKIYVNGELLNTTTLSLAPVYKSSNTPDVLCVGKVAYGYNFPAGGYYPSYCKQSDIRIYATALSVDKIKKLYKTPVTLSKDYMQAIEYVENPLYPSKYWRTPKYSEMYYILKTRTNASSLRTLCRVNISGSTYVNGLFLLPDDWTLPSGVSMTITTSDITKNTYSLDELQLIEDRGAIFLPYTMYRYGTQVIGYSQGNYTLSYSIANRQKLYFTSNTMYIASTSLYLNQYAYAVRLCYSAQGQHTFSTSASKSIKFAKSNLQYHCTQHKWRFAEHSYDYIGSANANISPTYNGWIDLFGYGTSGVNYAPTLHSTTNSDYASGDIGNTDNDWGVNQIQSYEYNNNAVGICKNGVVRANTISEGDDDTISETTITMTKIKEG